MIPMETSRPGRRRAKISVTLDPALLNAVDLYVQKHADLDRSKVMETALQHWYRARQDDAMIEQFSGPDTVESSEQQSWRRIRRAAVSRKLNRPAG
jgi:metal-responsive CopG/Arc/MetJ family transcriptional regulator